MEDFKKTDVSIRSDRAVGISSRAYGANIDAIVFNLDMVGEKMPTLAPIIQKLYTALKDVTPETPAQPEEDVRLAIDEIRKILEDLDG
jgi:hypothetical protein